MTEIDIKESVDEGEGIAPNVEVLEEIPEDGYIEENIDADGELDVEPDLLDDNIELDFEPEDDIIFEEDGLGDLDL